MSKTVRITSISLFAESEQIPEMPFLSEGNLQHGLLPQTRQQGTSGTGKIQLKSFKRIFKEFLKILPKRLSNLFVNTFTRAELSNNPVKIFKLILNF